MPSNADIRPTRLEYLRTKKRIKIAKKGPQTVKTKTPSFDSRIFQY